jgi:hypothetical protein
MHGKNAGTTENASRGSGWQDWAREGRTVAAHGHGASTRNHHGVKAGERGKTGRRCSLPQRGALGALARWRKEAERRRIRRPRCGGSELAWLGFVG